LIAIFDKQRQRSGVRNGFILSEKASGKALLGNAGILIGSKASRGNKAMSSWVLITRVVFMELYPRYCICFFDITSAS
jgi:hypothetical protein